MYLNCADSAKKNRKHLTTYSMNAPVFNKPPLISYTIINTLNWDSADLIAFSHIPAIDEALTFE